MRSDLPDDEMALLELASMIDEERPIDWAGESLARDARARAVLAELRVLAPLTRIYRDPDLEVFDSRGEGLERYEAARGRLTSEDLRAIVARCERGMSHEEVAQALGKPSANAARVAIHRALVRLAKEMAGGKRHS
jgi:DNA-directed RNA polymerase specialized sigma24 family protein